MKTKYFNLKHNTNIWNISNKLEGILNLHLCWLFRFIDRLKQRRLIKYGGVGY